MSARVQPYDFDLMGWDGAGNRWAEVVVENNDLIVSSHNSPRLVRPWANIESLLPITVERHYRGELSMILQGPLKGCYL